MHGLFVSKCLASSQCLQLQEILIFAQRIKQEEKPDSYPVLSASGIRGDTHALGWKQEIEDVVRMPPTRSARLTQVLEDNFSKLRSYSQQSTFNTKLHNNSYFYKMAIPHVSTLCGSDVYSIQKNRASHPSAKYAQIPRTPAILFRSTSQVRQSTQLIHIFDIDMRSSIHARIKYESSTYVFGFEQMSV